MFDIARAALLREGVREEDLPRTHSVVIGAFSKHAVLTGKIDQTLSAALGRAESLRLMADYTGTALDAKTASETAARAESFVSAVAKSFGLAESDLAKDSEKDATEQRNRISEPNLAAEKSESNYARLKPVSLEEIRRQARENWLQLRQQNVGATKGVGHTKNADRVPEKGEGQSMDDDLTE